MDVIDRKFKILAVNPVNGKIYTEKNAVLLCAKDAAVITALKAYYSKCIEIGCDDEHLMSISMLIDRIDDFQSANGARVPDTVGKEIERCILGIDLQQ